MCIKLDIYIFILVYTLSTTLLFSCIQTKKWFPRHKYTETHWQIKARKGNSSSGNKWYQMIRKVNKYHSVHSYSLKCFDVQHFQLYWLSGTGHFICPLRLLVHLYMINPQNAQLELTNNFTSNKRSIQIVLIQHSYYDYKESFGDSRLIRPPILLIFALLSWILILWNLRCYTLSC